MPVGPFEEPLPRALLKSVSDVVPRVEIESIRLNALGCKRSDVIPPSGSDISIASNHDAEYRVVGERELSVRVRFSLKAHGPGEGDSGSEFFQISAIYQLTYSSASSLADVAGEKLKSFAGTNAVHNAWPYWRELLQNTMSRMDLPAFTVPLLKVRTPRASRQDAKRAEQVTTEQ
jgi:hypothetical protein